MTPSAFLDPDSIRSLFSSSLSAMYRNEVPLYGALLDLVADVNAQALHADKAPANALRSGAQRDRLEVERHGAIRLGTPAELGTMRRLFAVMGMRAVGYYDLSVAGVPVHATAFRPVEESALQRNPLRVFTSLLRLELIADPALRAQAAEILRRRSIFTPRCVELMTQAERDGGLSGADAHAFVAEALETFRWHDEATVDLATYRELRASHPLVADVVCFKGPHINHLTPRVLDIDAAQAVMLQRGIRAKATIEGPPRRKCPILLRQTSFLALEEPVRFVGAASVEGSHTARFGEIEQRGCALTPKGRALYDALLDRARASGPGAPGLAAAFESFPDDMPALHRERLAYFRYTVDAAGLARAPSMPAGLDVDELLARGILQADALVYEDFLPISAAGIFRSNLGSEGAATYAAGGNRQVFEAALGVAVIDEFGLYEATQAASLAHCMRQLNAAQASFVNDRYAHAPGSPIRELKRFMDLPGMISLAGGYPAPELMDAAGLQSVLGGFSAAAFSNSLEYGGTEGTTGLRTELARLSTRRGIAAEGEDVLILSGSQQGIDMLARTVLTKGDTVLVEAPTYPAAISAFRFAGAVIHQVATDDQGLVLDDLQRAMVELKPRVLYTVPTFGNPSGRTLSADRRREVLRLAVQHQCLVIEDDPYGDLWFDRPPPPPLYALRHEVDGAERVVVYLSSLSKTLAPGLRLGWMLGPAALRRACVLAKQTDDMHASTVTQAMAGAYLAQGHFERHLPRLRSRYGQRAKALANALQQRLGPRIEFTAPGGGMFVWVRAPGVDTSAWLKAAIARGVMFVPGAAFYARSPDDACLRLSFASQDEEGLALGVARLEEALLSL